MGADTSLTWLRAHAAALLVKHRLDDLDGATIRQTTRAFTQDLSRWLYARTDPDLDGVQFESRHGDRLILWATFERTTDEGSTARIIDRSHDPLTAADPDLRRALRHHGLTLES